MKKLKNLFFKLFIGYFIAIGFFSLSFVKTSNDVSKFEILVETTKDGLKLTCKQGAAWKEVSFSLYLDQVQAINQFGMTEVNEKSEQVDKLASFLFTVKKTKNSIVLNGISGTSWKNLSFSCDDKCSQLIDQDGMVEKK